MLITLNKYVPFFYLLLALCKIQNKFEMESHEVQRDQETTYQSIHGLRSRFSAMFNRIHFTKEEHTNTDTII